MLNSQLIDTINSGEAWAFVGSGCSADAGFPLWNNLLDIAMKLMAAEHGTLSPSESIEISKHAKAERFPDAFSVLKLYYGASAVDTIIAELYSKDANPGPITTILSNWPFVAYVTTNYDP